MRVGGVGVSVGVGEAVDKEREHQRHRFGVKAMIIIATQSAIPTVSKSCLVDVHEAQVVLGRRVARLGSTDEEFQRFSMVRRPTLCRHWLRRSNALR